ncbi:hypothetical protein ACFQVC_22565 [Streptomyces monticola]|uniref:Uncharacterized protein n=1 Tax=Streptomyces monticola TaxID=2666263 RepID=A0ABW2JMJ6_9ACTN
MSDTMPGADEQPPGPPPGTPEPHEGPEEPAYDPAEPRSLGVARSATGNTEVDAQLSRLADVDHLATDGHIEVYEDVHRGLRDALTALDARPGPPAPAPSGPYDNRS